MLIWVRRPGPKLALWGRNWWRSSSHGCSVCVGNLGGLKAGTFVRKSQWHEVWKAWGAVHQRSRKAGRSSWHMCLTQNFLEFCYPLLILDQSAGGMLCITCQGYKLGFDKGMQGLLEDLRKLTFWAGRTRHHVAGAIQGSASQVLWMQQTAVGNQPELP